MTTVGGISAASDRTACSVLAPLRRWVEVCPDRLLYAFLDVDGAITESYTYEGLWARTTAIAVHVQRTCRLAPGDRVLLAYPPGLEVICAFFACVRLGLVPVPVYPPTSHGFASALYKMNFIARDCGAAAVLTDRSWYWSMKVNQARHRIRTFSWSKDAVSKLPWVVTSDAAGGTDAEVAEAHCDLLFLQYTSGSTSDPKGVMVTHDNLLDNGDAVVDHLPVGVSWLPQYHDMGLIGYYLFFALKGGTTYGFSPLDFIRRPALWLETISKYRGTASSAPNFAYEYCLRPGKLPPQTFEGLDLTSLRFLMNAAEPVRPQVYREFLATFTPYGLNPSAFFCAYGLAEYTLAVTNYGRRIRAFDREGLLRHEVRPAAAPGGDVTTLVSCGAPLGTAEVRIVEVEGLRDVTGRGVGEVWIDGRSKCQGYFARPELSEAVFGATLPEQPGRTWLRTGDLGFLHEGELFLCGRTKDLVIVRGLNYYPQDIELLVEQDGAVRKGCVAAFALDDGGREQVVVVAEVRDPRVLPDSHAIGARVQGALGVGVDRLVFIRPRTLPKTSSGKLVRHRARLAYEQGQLDVIAVVEPSILEDAPSADTPAPLQLGGFAEVLHRYGLTGHETWTLPEAGLDSIRLVDFASELRDQLVASGHGRLAGAVDLQVLQTIALCELCELLEQLATAAPHAQLRFQKALVDLGREHRTLEVELMRRDARLRFDPRHLPRTGPARTEGPVLLTGGTGFFGPFLLASLLAQTTDEVWVLVRAEDEASGLRRLRDGLRSVGAFPPEWDSRLRAVCGDLTRTNLGLSTARWGALAEEVRAIYHNGAWVNYLFDYAAMREANVGGTNEVVRLAMSHRPKVLNHISTTFVFGWSVKDTLFEGDRNDDLDLLDFGYSQSKWVSEQVVFDAMRQGLHARIFRPALITPSVQGAGENFDISVRLLAFMLQHGLGTTAANQVSFMPADVAADNIVAIAGQSGSLGGTFHVTRDDYAKLADVTALLAELTGTDFRYFDLDAFVPEVIERCQPGDILFPLLHFFVRSTDKITKMAFKRYDNSGYRRFRDEAPGGRSDPPLRDVVLGLLRFMRRHGIVPEEG